MKDGLSDRFQRFHAADGLANQLAGLQVMDDGTLRLH
jgi:hypothetical protein